MTPLAQLFPSEAFRFHLRLRRGEPDAFFRRQDPSGRVLAERRRWLLEAPSRYAQISPEGGTLLSEFIAFCAGCGLVDPAAARAGEADVENPEASLLRLGGCLEPDFLLLSADPEGRYRLRGGALCFPTGWALEEKLGHTLDFIHGVVPGLNPALGGPIDQFLGKLKPGVAYLRDNWGIAASDELNLHPSRGIAALESPVDLERLWLRVEHQTLFALPTSRGIVFGIRIALHRLDRVLASDPVAALGLRMHLESMPEALLSYKRIDQIRSELVAKLNHA